jgi:predicted signal transduction protein with EAL and GGDEF domain
VDLGHNLGLRVVAEGVEDEATWQELATLGCDSLQGYYLARPMPAAELTAWLVAQPQPSPPTTDPSAEESSLAPLPAQRRRPATTS